MKTKLLAEGIHFFGIYEKADTKNELKITTG
jgi:hypothetical protein